MRLTSFAIGPVAAAIMLLVGPMGGMSPSAWRTAAVGLWMGLWWVTEAVPIAGTALLPLVLLPLLGIANINAAAAPYANPVIYLFFGGFILAAAFERSGLHRRLALSLLTAVGTRPDRIIAGFMIAGGLMSMWVSNTATVLMLLPLVNSMLVGTKREAAAGTLAPATDFEKALLLGIAYAATIGGFGTLVGTPPNALLAGFLTQTHGIRVGFLDYMMIGVPIVVVGLPVTWFILTRVAYRIRDSDAVVSADAVRAQRMALGPTTRAESFVAVVASCTAIAWMTQPWLARLVPGISEAGISVACAVVLLACPMDRNWTRALDWHDAERIPWGVLVLFGGGLSLAGAIQDGGLAKWIGDSVGALRSLHPLLLLLIVTTVITFLGEFTSNTATAAAFLPIASSLASGAGMNPLLLAVAVGLAASNGFMMPVGTPPNAIVFAGGRLAIPEMARAGFLIDILFIVLVTTVSYLLVLPVLG
ncbi:MAG: DASS family sodium-coupled anion symporter [Gemmatimonadaceae bacterium]